MSKGEIQKGYHCAWQIYYHIIFPANYRKALLDKMVIKIIEETAEGIQGRYAIEMEVSGMDKNHIHLLSNTHPKISPGEIVRIFKKYYCKGDIPKASGDQRRVMGWRILVRLILYCNCW
jgi:putative transposase